MKLHSVSDCSFGDNFLFKPHTYGDCIRPMLSGLIVLFTVYMPYDIYNTVGSTKRTKKKYVAKIKMRYITKRTFLF